MKTNANIMRNPETTIAPVLFKNGKRELTLIGQDIVVVVVKKDEMSNIGISGLDPNALGAGLGGLRQIGTPGPPPHIPSDPMFSQP